jgi:hypothetical protein
MPQIGKKLRKPWHFETMECHSARKRSWVFSVCWSMEAHVQDNGKRQRSTEQETCELATKVNLSAGSLVRTWHKESAGALNLVFFSKVQIPKNTKFWLGARVVKTFIIPCCSWRRERGIPNLRLSGHQWYDVSAGIPQDTWPTLIRPCLHYYFKASLSRWDWHIISGR